MYIILGDAAVIAMGCRCGGPHTSDCPHPAWNSPDPIWEIETPGAPQTIAPRIGTGDTWETTAAQDARPCGEYGGRVGKRCAAAL